MNDENTINPQGDQSADPQQAQQGAGGQIIGGDPEDQWTFPVGGIPQTDIDEIMNMPIPQNPHEFDQNKFKTLLANSVSLTKNEKVRIVESLPKLSQYQVTELIRILEEEKKKFEELEEKHKKQLEEFEKKRAEADKDKEKMQSEESAKKEEEQKKQEELRKKLGL